MIRDESILKKAVGPDELSENVSRDEVEESREDRRSATCVLIVNRDSGTVSDLWDSEFEKSIVDRLKGNGWVPEVRRVAGKEIEGEVRAAQERKVGAIMAGGGDGTTSSVAKLMLGSPIPMGILPFGTLNLAARDLGSSLDPLEAVGALRPGKTKRIDVLEIGDRLCLCVMVVGVYPELLKNGEEFHGRNWWRKFTGMGSTFIRSFINSPRLSLSVKLEEEDLKVKSRMLFVVAGTFEDDYGLIPRRESLESGQCTLFVSKHKSLWSLIRMIANFTIGRTKADPDLETYSAAEMTIDASRRKSILAAIDGELTRMKLPIALDLNKKALLVLEPDSGDVTE